MGGKVQGIRSIIGRHNIDRKKFRIVWETEKPKNIYVQSMDLNQVWGWGWFMESWVCRAEADEQGNIGKTVIA